MIHRARSWNVDNSPACHAMVDRMMSCVTLQAPYLLDVDDDTLQQLPVLEITTANEQCIEISSSTQQTLPEQV